MPRQTPESENPEKHSRNPTTDTEESDSEQKKSADRSSDTDTLSALRKIHHELVDLLDTINKKSPERQKDNVQQLRTRWFQHSCLEEEFLLPELKKRGIESAELLEGEVKRDLVKLLLVNLRADRTDSAEDAARLRVLDTFIRQLVEAEEKPETGLFARIQSLNLADIGEHIAERKKELEEDGLPDPVLNHLSFDDFIHHPHEQEAIMTNRERDAQGRFVSEDDRRYRRRDDDDRRYGRYDDDDRRGGEGRYASRRDYEDDRRYGRRGDEGYSRDRGQGGWFGDPEGHAEAARRGWDERRDYDDDRRGRSYSRSRDDDDRRYGGRYDEGYSRDRGQGGWFGDPEGHAEAARRGWDERRDYDDDRRGRSYSRSRDDDDRRYGRRDDEGYSRDRGQGGWFGDPEGHAQAARRGWRHREDY
ncbi:hypothetical protein ACUSIJ_22785 [Pseudochelatococcus sp. B33]